MSKRIIFSTATPNDQGGIIPNDVLDFSRFAKNPVVLNEHKWDEDPLGMWTDIRLENDAWTGVPVFHEITEISRTKKALYDGGWLRAASIGGEAMWKTTGRKIKNADGEVVPEFEYDAQGNRICVKFYVYEISIVTLPSNEDAVQMLHAKVYNDGECERGLTKLSSHFNNHKNQTKMTPEEKVAQEALEKAASEKAALAAKEDGSSLPKWMQDILKLGGKLVLGSEPEPKNTPESKQQKDKKITDPQPKPIGLAAKKAEKAKADCDKAAEEAEAAAEKFKTAKAKADAEGATKEDMEACEKAKNDAEDAMKAYEEAEKAYNKYKAKAESGDDDEEEEIEEGGVEKAKEKSKNSSKMKPQFKTSAQMKDELKLASAPSHQARVNQVNSGKTFSQLAASKDGNDQRLLGRVLTKDGGGKEIAEYAAVLNSIMADGKYSAIVDKTRVLANVSENQLKTFQGNPQARAGVTLQQLAAQLNRGEVEVRGEYNTMKNITTLSSTDNALASPALNTIEWLSLAIFKLFPNSSWKNEIPIFGAEITGKNTGIIWANIAADPTIYKGNQPTPGNYTYTDTAVSLSLTPYWMQPMLWTPLTMHQLRYDQMGTGWAQAFAKWNAVIDDNLIYTLASTVPASSIVSSSGLSGYQTSPMTFNINGANDPNAFYYNPSFTGSLKNPVLNDIITTEQIYNRQNFELANERTTLVVDPTMDALFAKDPETKSLLTRWVNQDGGEFTKFKNTILPQRSRVAIYDPATGQVKDPNATIPSTAVSAALGFIPSQVGMGLGMLDVFMIQDPTSYGYKMSADIRIGIVPLRSDFLGTTLLTYGAANV